MSAISTAAATTAADPTTGTPAVAETSCDPATSVTRSLLGYGIVAGPIYVATSLVEAATREGFDLSRHAWSLLANGPMGWVHAANLTLTGLMTLAFAVGLRRSTARGERGRSAPALLGVFGLSLIGAAVFTADPTLGFPVGTPEGPGTVTLEGILHLVAGAVGFTALVIGCFVLARRFAGEGRRRWAVASRAVGVAFLAGFGAMASGSGGAAANLAFTATVVAMWAWVSAVALDRYRRTVATSVTTS